MRRTARVCLVLALAGIPLSANAQGYGRQGARAPATAVESTGSIGRAPWQPGYAYDSGSDNDRHPELPYYQQGGGMQTGGPARNLIPSDRFQIVPR